MGSLRDKELVVFDLDGTLTKTKSDLAPDMARALTALLKQKRVAVIGGGTYRQFKKQLIAGLKCPPELLKKLFLFPTTANSFYRYQGGWKKVYRFELAPAARAAIKKAFKEVLREINYLPPQKTYGSVIEDRGTQVTFSALGQDVVARLGAKGVALKEQWTKKNTSLKLTIAKMVQKKLPRFEVHAAGFTSIDVTAKGIDKAYGVRQIEKYLHVPIKNMVFIGDALYPGGNDHAAKRTGITCIPVKGPNDTKRIIKRLIKD